ncbi:MAG: A/G-specific adenine glycosylase [Leptospira sp.]|nr:A/G-specific adenine glycosylase [Leptospira sp.]
MKTSSQISPNLNLLEWFHKHKRDLPFRIKPTAYKIWVSEVMLQQTRVAAMLPLYDQFLLRFPNMESLAQAEEEEVLEFWSGLGYYSRARNLRKACNYVISNYNGKFPESLEEAMDIPGVGPYTARAVLSMAYGKSYAVLDGNVKRVVSRLFAESDERKWQTLADQFLNKENPGDHNQAMMELGALVCLPNPICENCPIQSACKASLTNTISKYPPSKKDKEKLDIEIHFYIIQKNQKILLLKDKNRRFFKDIYSLPYTILPKDDETKLGTAYLTPGYLKELLEDLKTTAIPGTTKHSITHHRISVYLHQATKEFSDKNHILPGAEIIWTDWERLPKDFPSSIAKKVLKFPGVGGLFST